MSKSTSRRAVLAGIATAPAAALTTPAVALAVSSSAIADSDLTAAVSEMMQLDRALNALYRKFGDDADSRDDYFGIERRRDEVLKILATVPASSWRGIEAKAEALKTPLVDDYDRALKIAKSLADDILRLSANPRVMLPAT